MTDRASASGLCAAGSRAWLRFWFPTGTVVPLAVCRIVLVPAWQLFLAVTPDDYFVPLTYDPARIDQVLIRAVLLVVPVEVFHTEAFLGGVWLAANVAGMLAMVGLFTRSALLTLGLGYWVLVGHQWSYGELHHTEALYCIAFVLLALSPSGRCYSVDAWLGRRGRHPERWGPDARTDTATWALRLMQCLLGLAYFSAGSAKLLDGGLYWMNGATLQQIVLTDYIRFGMPAGLWLIQSFWLCVAGAVMTIAVETFFFVAVFVKRARKYLLAAGVVLHLGIYFTMAAPFFTWMVLYVVFLDFEALRRRAERAGSLSARNIGRPEPLQEGCPRADRKPRSASATPRRPVVRRIVSISS